MFELLTSLVGAAICGLVLSADPDQVLPALVAGGGASLAGVAFWRSRRRVRRPVALASTSFLLVFVLNYPVQYVVAGLMYQSAEWAPLLRSFSIRPIQAGWFDQIPVFCEICLAFGLMAAALTGLHAAVPGHAAARSPRPAAGRGVSRQGLAVLLAAALALAAIGVPVQFVLDIGSLTAQANAGYRLDGVLYHLLVTLLPVLLLAVHAAARRAGWRGLSRAGLGAFVALALIETAMMSSRGYVVLQMTMVLLVYLWEGPRLRAAGGVVLATLAGALVLYPVVTSVRILRSNLGFSPGESLALAWDSIQAEDHQRTALLLVSRFVGYTSYLVGQQYGGERFDFSRVDPLQVLSLRDSSFTRWYTETAAGYGVGVRGHFSSPGIMGAGLVMGGSWLAWCLPGLFAMAAAWSVDWMSNRAGPLGAVLPAVWLGNLLFVFNEGTPDLGWTRLVLTLLALVLVSGLFRVAASRTAGGAGMGMVR